MEPSHDPNGKLRHAWDLTVHCWVQLQRLRAEGMAAELTYRTIFSLIPVVVLGLVMFRIVGGLQEVQGQVENQLYSFFGVPEIPEIYDQDFVAQDSDDDDPQNGTGQRPSRNAGHNNGNGQANGRMPFDNTSLSETDPVDGLGSVNKNGNGAASGQGIDGVVDLDEAIAVSEMDDDTKKEVEAESRRQARASIRRTLTEVTAKVASVDFKSIGVFGLLLFIYAAVALADSTEHLFNRIYDAPSQRPIHIRLAIHWSIITLGSGLLAMSLYMSGQMVDWFVEIGAGSRSRLLLNHVLSVAASWVLLFLLYALMPNTHVSVRAAAIGALAGSMLWEFAKLGFQIYVAKAVPYSAIYGSIGLIPLFLFWIYITWLIVLFGLILTNTLQTFGKRGPGRTSWSEDAIPLGDPDWMLPIMSEVASAFAAGQSLGHQEMSEKIGLSPTIVHQMTSKLIEAKLLRRVTASAGEEETLTLARPAESIDVREILEIAHRTRPTSDHPAWKSLENLKRAERDASIGKTLADLAEIGEANDDDDDDDEKTDSPGQVAADIGRQHESASRR
jgi:membrane protein